MKRQLTFLLRVFLDTKNVACVSSETDSRDQGNQLALVVPKESIDSVKVPWSFAGEMLTLELTKHRLWGGNTRFILDYILSLAWLKVIAKANFIPEVIMEAS